MRKERRNSKNCIRIMAMLGVLLLSMLPASMVSASAGDMDTPAATAVQGDVISPILREVLTGCPVEIGIFGREVPKHTEELMEKGWALLYDTYIPALDEALPAYRENQIGEVSYAYFDRYVLHENYSNSEGKLTLFFENGNCTGLCGQLFCREDFYYYLYEHDAAERRFYCEYYELEGMQYFSFAEDGKDKSKIEPPLFMCMKDMERLHTVEEEEEIPYTVYTKLYEESVYDYVPSKEEQRELLFIDNRLYRIDREAQALYLLSEENAVQDAVFVNWMQDLGQKCQNEGANYVSAKELEAYLPKNYSIYDEYTLETADLNGDGILDVLAELLPIRDSYEGYQGDYGRFVDKYYYRELWGFMGKADGGYEARCIFPVLYERGRDRVLLSIRGYSGGFTLEFYAGWGVHEDRLQHYTYREAEDDFVYSGYTGNVPDVPGFGYIKLDNSQVGGYRLSLQKFSYEVKELPSFSDEELAKQLNLTLAAEADKFFAAEHNWNLTGLRLAFANSRVLVFYLEQYYNTVHTGRVIPITVDFRTGEIVDYRDYLSPEEFGEIFAKLFTDEESTTLDAAALYEVYDDYDKLMSIHEDSLTVRLTQEGLLVYISTEDTVWPKKRLIPRSALIDTPLAALWDDWPGEMY